MTDGELLDLFDREMRLDVSSEPGLTVEFVEGVVRAYGDYNGIFLSRLQSASVQQTIRDQVAFFDRIGETWDWKVYGHDTPADLTRHLSEARFVPDERETLMVLSIETRAPHMSGFEIREVLNDMDIAEYAATNSLAFGRPFDVADAKVQWERDDTRLFIASTGGRAAAAGRLELPRGKRFASIWGGGTVPDLRGRGIYRALVEHRIGIGRDHGYEFITVDAREISRPILEGMGFRALTWMQDWRLTTS